ncbi:MAG: xylulokinase [Trueperaceae bacterium]|nr:xylulokinase [Trueperaceae bacterium]
MKRYILAHDLGTTGNKASLYDDEGKLIASSLSEYGTFFEHAGWAEQNPEDWWQAICKSTRQLLEQSKTPKSDIACIVFSGQMMGCVPLSKAAKPLRNAIIWADVRATNEASWLGKRISADEVYKISGHRLSASYSLAKILWIREHQKDIYDATHKFVHAKDAMVARLTGNFVTDYSDASGMNLYALERNTWSEEILEASELAANKLPDLKRSIDVVGEVLPGVAEEVGLAAGTPVVVGGGDGCCAATGAGVIKEGRAYNYLGSSSWIALATQKPIFDPSQRTFTWAHLIPGMFSPCGTMQAAGASYAWAKQELAPLELGQAQEQNISVYELMNQKAQSSKIGASGLLYLPYLLGERSPRWNPKARGAFVGLDIRHTRADLFRAVLEGVTLNLKVIMDTMTAQGVTIDAMRVIGGGAKGKLWNQLMADIYGVPVECLAILEEATSMGAAIAGGVGVGLYQDFSIAETMNPVSSSAQVDPTAHKKYQELLPIFNKAYEALVPIYEDLADWNL